MNFELPLQTSHPNSYSLMSEYSDVAYWNERYGEDSEPFEWYMTSEQFCSIITPTINAIAAEQAKTTRSIRALVVGCGTSTLAMDLVQRGLVNHVTAVDFSSNAINIQSERINAHSTEQIDLISKAIRLECADARSLPFDVHSFDVIIDKGTLDCVGCDDDETKVSAALNEYVRVCKSGGYMLIISHSDMSSRQPWWDHITGLLAAIKCTVIRSVPAPQPPPPPAAMEPPAVAGETATAPTEGAVPVSAPSAEAVPAVAPAPASSDIAAVKSETTDIAECYLYKLQKR